MKYYICLGAVFSFLFFVGFCCFSLSHCLALLSSPRCKYVHRFVIFIHFAIAIVLYQMIKRLEIHQHHIIRFDFGCNIPELENPMQISCIKSGMNAFNVVHATTHYEVLETKRNHVPILECFRKIPQYTIFSISKFIRQYLRQNNNSILATETYVPFSET